MSFGFQFIIGQIDPRIRTGRSRWIKRKWVFEYFNVWASSGREWNGNVFREKVKMFSYPLELYLISTVESELAAPLFWEIVFFCQLEDAREKCNAGVFWCGLKMPNNQQTFSRSLYMYVIITANFDHICDRWCWRWLYLWQSWKRDQKLRLGKSERFSTTKNCMDVQPVFLVALPPAIVPKLTICSLLF